MNDDFWERLDWVLQFEPEFIKELKQILEDE